MIDFTHLHVHTQFSILDGAAEIKKLIAKTKEYGMKALAITDHGNMYGVLQFVEECYKQGIKPIIGCEMYVAEGSRFEKKGKEDRSGYHLILLAKNYEGYKNLSKLSSIGFKEGFYYTPRIDKEVLALHSKNLIALSACIGGEIPQMILEKGIDAAELALKEYLDIFGEDFYLEMQNHGLHEQVLANEGLMALAKKHKVKLVASNDIHYVNPQDAEAHDILVCLNTGKDFNDPTRMRYTGFEYLRSPEEMEKLFPECPEALLNTMDVCNKIEPVQLKRDVILPVFPLPKDFANEDEYLHHLTMDGAKILYVDLNDEILERINFELSVIKKMGFAGYFLIVQDFINEARKKDVAVGPGRGSAAGSVVAYCIGITGLDPIKYRLLFERFLNPERISMPDIDIDFDDDGRELVIKYVAEKYGYDKVAQIVTFGTMAARSAIKDVARVLKLPLPEAAKIANLIPERAGTSLAMAFKEVKELSDIKTNGSELARKTLAFAEILEGSARHTGTHACGVIIGPEALIEHIPLCNSKDSELMATQFEGKFVESVGMLKMDFLGLKNLSIIKDTIENIYKRHGKKIDISKIDLEDAKTYELFQRGDTVGIFQFESEGMQKHLRDLKPTNIEDLIAMNALYRPGPMGNIPTYINRKHGREKVSYPHPVLEEILKSTFGIMVYQEQIMQISQKLAGFSGGKADELRKAMGKKKMDLIAKLRTEFIEGAQKLNVIPKQAEEIYDTMAKFGEYGFNRSHSAAYSFISYQTAYLKANYPAEYMAAILSRHLNNISDITFFMDECKRAGLPVLGPDINESEMKFIVNAKGEIRFGLAAIKNVGEAAVEAIVEERNKNGIFKTIFDLTKRINMRLCNKRCLEGLAMSGAFECFQNVHRAQYFFKAENEGINFLDKVIKHVILVQSKGASSQVSLFGEVEELEIPDPQIPECERWSTLDMLSKEKEVTGIYISGHPLDNYRIEIENFCNIKLNDLNMLDKLKNRDFSIAGIVTSVVLKMDKNGNPFMRFTIEDYDGSFAFMLFSKDYINFKGYAELGRFLYIKGKVTLRRGTEDQWEPHITSIDLLPNIREKMVKFVTLHVPADEVSDVFVKKIQKIINTHKGNSVLRISLKDTFDKVSLDMQCKKIKIEPTNEFFNEVMKIAPLSYKLN